jgi:hypothetical protein
VIGGCAAALVGRRRVSRGPAAWRIAGVDVARGRRLAAFAGTAVKRRAAAGGLELGEELVGGRLEVLLGGPGQELGELHGHALGGRDLRAQDLRLGLLGTLLSGLGAFGGLLLLALVAVLELLGARLGLLGSSAVGSRLAADLLDVRLVERLGLVGVRGRIGRRIGRRVRGRVAFAAGDAAGGQLGADRRPARAQLRGELEHVGMHGGRAGVLLGHVRPLLGVVGAPAGARVRVRPPGPAAPREAPR